MAQLDHKGLGIILSIIGVAAFWYTGLKSASPPDVGQSVQDWITTITGVISCIIGVLAYFKKGKRD